MVTACDARPVTSPAASHLRLVADEPTPAPAAQPAVPAAPDAGVLRAVVVIAVLVAVLALLGTQPWSLPQRAGGAVTGVPQSLVTFLLICAGGCLWAAGRVTEPAEVLGSAREVRVWWALVTAATVVSVTAALSLASYAGNGDAPEGVLVRWAVPLVPALLAGAIAWPHGRAARLRAALGTGVVTVPLFALGWALTASPAGSPAGLPDALMMTLLAGVTPFALAVAFVAGGRRT